MGETAIIIARGGSKRIPRKNLTMIEGHPLIWWQVKHVKSCRLIDKVYLSTDDDEIATVGMDAGAEFIRRPLWPDSAPGNVPFCHAMEVLKDTGEGKDRYILFLGACILWKIADVAQGITKCDMFSNEYQVGPVIRKNDIVLQEIDHRGFCNFKMMENKPGMYAVTPGSGWVVMPTKLYLDFNYQGTGQCQILSDASEFANKPGNHIDINIPIWVEQWQVFDLDFPRDLEVVEYFFKKHVMEEINV
jgi:hypothetical protein